MSHWSRKYDQNDEIQVSKETQRYIKQLQIRSDNTSFLDQNEDDDITSELMRRIEMNSHSTTQPKEVRQARKVIQNWLQIENEAQYIRSHSYQSPNTLIKHKIRTNLRRKRLLKKQNDTKQFRKSSSAAAFDQKFAKMKSKALNRHKNQSFEPNQIKQYALEFKDEENSPNYIQNIYNAEQKSRFDLIPSAVYNKRNGNKRYLNKLETKKVLLFQLNEIEKQERYYNKKLIIKICIEWKAQIHKSTEIQKKAMDLYTKNILKHAFLLWIKHRSHTKECKQIKKNVFREWIKIRLISQENAIKAIEFYEEGLKDNILFVWRDYTKQSIATRKIRAMQIQTRLYKMNKIAQRHYKCVMYYKIVKYWKEYANDEQSQRFLEQQRQKRKLKLQKLITSVQQKTKNEMPHKIIHQKTAKNIQTKSMQISEIKPKKKEEILKKKSQCLKSLKPPKLISAMEKRALERKQKREQIMELKKQKEREYNEYMLRQKKLEIGKMQEFKRLDKERKLRKLQKQMHLKEIENNKLILSKLHNKRALIMYYAWIPWMQYMERSNLNCHKIVLIRNNNIQKQFWRLWQSVIEKRKRNKSNSKMAACVGRQMISNKLFKIRVESKYWSFWKDIILRYKMMNAMISEKRRINAIKTHLQRWKKHYELELNKQRIRQHSNEERANKHGNVVLMKRLMIRWRKQSEKSKKEKIKARAWRKVELWLTEIRAKR